MIILYTDFKSPAAYLALKPTLALIEEYSLDTKWLPYITKQEAIQAQQEIESKTETHFRVRAIARRDTHLRYAEVQGTQMNIPDVPGETDLALAALLLMNEDPVPFIESAFRAYWTEGADLNDEATVRGLLEASGYEPNQFDLAGARAKLPDHQLATEEAGVVDTPAYVIDGQIFIGREHLPWIRSLLGGDPATS